MSNRVKIIVIYKDIRKEMTVTTTTTVVELREKIQAVFNLYPDKLLFQELNVTLSDSKTLLDYKISDLDEITIIQNNSPQNDYYLYSSSYERTNSQSGKPPSSPSPSPQTGKSPSVAPTYDKQPSARPPSVAPTPKNSTSSGGSGDYSKYEQFEFGGEKENSPPSSSSSSSSSKNKVASNQKNKSNISAYDSYNDDDDYNNDYDSESKRRNEQKPPSASQSSSSSSSGKKQPSSSSANKPPSTPSSSSANKLPSAKPQQQQQKQNNNNNQRYEEGNSDYSMIAQYSASNIGSLPEIPKLQPEHANFHPSSQSHNPPKRPSPSSQKKLPSTPSPRSPSSPTTSSNSSNNNGGAIHQSAQIYKSEYPNSDYHNAPISQSDQFPKLNASEIANFYSAMRDNDDSDNNNSNSNNNNNRRNSNNNVNNQSGNNDRRKDYVQNYYDMGNVAIDQFRDNNNNGRANISVDKNSNPNLNNENIQINNTNSANNSNNNGRISNSNLKSANQNNESSNNARFKPNAGFYSSLDDRKYATPTDNDVEISLFEKSSLLSRSSRAMSSFDEVKGPEESQFFTSFDVRFLYHCISIILCLLSYFIWVLELIPCVLSIILFLHVDKKFSVKTIAISVVNILVTLIVPLIGYFWSIHLFEDIFGVSVNTTPLFFVLPYLYVVFVCVFSWFASFFVFLVK